MENVIKEHLLALEKERGIKILLAVESGSRAWGCASPDSDYDVRIIYQRERDWYVSVFDRKEVIDYFHGELLDVNGWDVRKVLRLLGKSNASVFEWNQSPVVYMDRDGFQQKLMGLCEQYFQPTQVFQHYRGISKSFVEVVMDDKPIKLKKFFYVIRPLLAAKWIMERGNIPPMDIPSLMVMVEDVEIVSAIEELITLKSTLDESGLHVLEWDVRKYVQELYEEVREYDDLEKVEVDTGGLDEFFRELIKLV